MRERNDPRLSELKEIFRRGDPAAGDSMTPDQLAAQRRAILGEAQRPRSRSMPGASLLTSMAAALALVLGLLIWRAPESVSPAQAPRTGQAAPAPAPSPAGERLAARQVYFRTANGTQLVWTLLSDGDAVTE